MRKFRMLFFSVLGFTILFMSGCQVSKYDTFDAGEYASKNLDIDVLSLFCTGEVGFEGSEKYDLVSDEREVCFILGEKQTLEYVYSYGMSKNTKLIRNEPSILSSNVINHFEDLGIDVKYWKYIYLGEIDTLVYQITTEEYSEYFIFIENDEYQYYTYSPNASLTNLTQQELVELESETE